MKRLLLCLFLISSCFASCFAGEMTVLGVQERGDEYIGLFATLNLEIISGSGRVFFNTMPLAETDTQSSARMAVDVACQTLEINCNDKDFLYSISANSPMIGGPSAGAAMSILAMSELMGADLRTDAAITGTINPDKSIGVVGGVVEKAKICQESGLKTILIPKGTKYLFENESLSIDIIEVETINQAYAFFSGIIFSEPSSELNKSKFNDFMKIMSENLIDYANSSFNQLINTNISKLNNTDSLSIESLINSTSKDIETMNELYLQENYYSASSYSVRVGINSIYTTYLIDYLLNLSDLPKMIIELNTSINVFENNFGNKLIIDNANDFEAISISIERMFEAKDLLNSSIDNLLNNDSISALYNLAFAKVRLKTSESWFGLKDLLTGDLYYEFNQDDFSELAYTRIENAKTLLNYAKSMQESYYTEASNDLIDRSVQAYNNGNIVFSLFESLKSISNSNLALSLAGVTDENLDERITILMDLAAKNINMAESKKIIPILAYSYYEYGQTFKESEPLQAIIFFEYSKQFSLLSEQLASQAISKENNETINDYTFMLPKLTISFLIGLLIALLVLEVYYERALFNKRQ
ncbi:MAG: S16 family serine protease [Candidatus Nanoarchaeia archaeon]